MEDRATLEFHLNILQLASSWHARIDQVLEILKKMAKVVDKQNEMTLTTKVCHQSMINLLLLKQHVN